MTKMNLMFTTKLEIHLKRGNKSAALSRDAATSDIELHYAYFGD